MLDKKNPNVEKEEQAVLKRRKTKSLKIDVSLVLFFGFALVSERCDVIRGQDTVFFK